MRTLICKINPQAELTCDCDGCLGCKPAAYVTPCEGPERVEMFVVRGRQVVTCSGIITYAPTDDPDVPLFLVSEEGGWMEIGEDAFYLKEEAELQAEKRRQANISYHEKALEELRKKS